MIPQLADEDLLVFFLPLIFCVLYSFIFLLLIDIIFLWSCSLMSFLYCLLNFIFVFYVAHSFWSLFYYSLSFFSLFVLFTDFYIFCCSLITSLSVGSQCSVLLIQPQSSDCSRKAKRINCLITLCWQFWHLHFFVLPANYFVLLTDFILLLLTYYSHLGLIAQEFDWFNILDGSWYDHHTLFVQEKQIDL